jgi:hypothetical protein
MEYEILINIALSIGFAFVLVLLNAIGGIWKHPHNIIRNLYHYLDCSVIQPHSDY